MQFLIKFTPFLSQLLCSYHCNNQAHQRQPTSIADFPNGSPHHDRQRILQFCGRRADLELCSLVDFSNSIP